MCEVDDVSGITTGSFIKRISDAVKLEAPAKWAHYLR